MTVPKRILLLVIDTLRADHLGCYGYGRNTSPNMDRLAAESIIFSHAFTPVSYTLPAIASLFTSKRPEGHGIGLSQASSLTPGHDVTLAELLRDKGYATAAFVSSIILRKATKLDLGFDIYDDEMTAVEVNRPDVLFRDGQETIGRALRHLERIKDKESFTFIHLRDVHGPYICPAPYDTAFVGDSQYGKKEVLEIVKNEHPCLGIPSYQVLRAPGAATGNGTGFIDDARFYRARYDGCIRKSDALVGNLVDGLKSLGIYDDTFFILTADHGEALGENGIYFFHGITVTPEQLAVPLLLKPSKNLFFGPAKMLVHVSTLDLMPTILSSCGICPSRLELDGKPLQTLIEKGQDPELSDRELVCINECQDAHVNPDGGLVLQMGNRPYRGHYACVPDLLERLAGKRFDWRTGKEFPIAVTLRQEKVKQLRDVIRNEKLSVRKAAKIAYLAGSIALPLSVKRRIMSLAPALRYRPKPLKDSIGHADLYEALLPFQPDSNTRQVPKSLRIEKLATRGESLNGGKANGHSPSSAWNDAWPVLQKGARHFGAPLENGASLFSGQRQLKVALFVHCFFPRHFYGTETYTLHIADSLRRLGHKPVVVSAASEGNPEHGQLVTRYTYDGIPIYCIDKNFAPHTSFRESYYQENMRGVLRYLVQEIRPDLVHVTHLANHTGVLLEVIDDLGLPVVATLTDFFGICLNSWLKAPDGSQCAGPDATRTNCITCYLNAGGGQSLKFASKWPRLTATALSTVSFIPGLKGDRIGRLAQDIRSRPDILTSCYSKYKAAIMPTRFLHNAYVANGLSIPCFDIPFGVDLPRDAKPAWENGRPVTFGFIGQIAPHKGTDLLIDAFIRLPRGSATLQIYGPENQVPAYVAELKQAAEGHSIQFKGIFPSAQMADVLRDIDVLVVPSRWSENSPLVLLDALATHTPVVVSDAPGLTEFIDEGRNGFKFAIGSADALEHELRKFVEDPQLASRLSLSTEYPRTTNMMVEEVLRVYSFALD
jgi:arylsulfatase A-like enzyme/glycosyltransferase involved in cell wall biosynthesis